MDIFLRAKHWQLFLVLVVLPIIIGIVVLVSMLTSIRPEEQPDPVRIFSHLKYLPAAFILFMVVKMCWQWAVAIRLQRLAPPGVQFKNTMFQIFFWFALLFYPLMMVAMIAFFNAITSSISTTGAPPMVDPSQFIWFIAIFPLSLFNTFCMFYCYYYSARTFKSVELQREATFSDFVLECVLVWFFFIGVWILQPKINKMIDPEVLPEQPWAGA